MHRFVRLALAVAALFAVTAPAFAQEVTERPISGFPHAKVYTLPGDDARPVVVILHGADGGTEAGDRFGPILARMGYAAVGLPYYSPDWGDHGPPKALPELPGSFLDIRVDQIGELREALRAMPGVDVERFGLLGASKGSEFALIAASRYPWIDSVVATRRPMWSGRAGGWRWSRPRARDRPSRSADSRWPSCPIAASSKACWPVPPRT